MPRTGIKPRSRRLSRKSTSIHPPLLTNIQCIAAMSHQIHTFAELRVQIREALRRQHPDWIDANGKSPLCDSSKPVSPKLLAIFTPHESVAAS